MSTLEGLRDEFPVLASKAYLNAGTHGPSPRRAAQAAARELAAEERDGRGTAAHFEAISELVERLRAAVAPLFGCGSPEVAMTRSTTDGINVVLGALDLSPGDEVLTSEEEHPGLLAPLAAARARRGFEVRAVPFADVAEEVGEGTRLVACSHVSWVSGQIVDGPALSAAARAAGARVMLDGAQGLGAVDFDVDELGCDFYAAAGQKWLCGPDGSGFLYVRPERLEEMAPTWPSFVTLADPARPHELAYKAGAARFDLGVTARAQAAATLAAIDTLAEAGWASVLERGPTLAAELAHRLTERGVRVLPRGPSTLVSWESPEDSATEVERLARAGFVVRELPGLGLVRASVGAWSTAAELVRLAELVAPASPSGA